MNPAAVASSPLCSAVNLRLVPKIAPLRSPDEPQFLSSEPPQNIRCGFIQTHEAGASVPRNSAMAGATLHTIMVAGCPASLPPELLEVDYVSHEFALSVGVSQTQHNQERVHGDGKAFRRDGKADANR